MKRLACETWDDGRLIVNANFAKTLRANGLTTFDAIMHTETGAVAKNLRRDRTTHRVLLETPSGESRDFYIKRHWPASWRELIKPLLRFSKPIVGAKNEWYATQHFLNAGIATTVPVAFGRRSRASFLITEGIRDSTKLTEWFADSANVSDGACGNIIDRIACTTAQMHAAGLHHQDFYLGHLMLPADRDRGIQVLDLGRARRRRRLSSRWIVKDLAQLKYSARELPGWAVERLFARYFESRVSDRSRMIRWRIDRKVDRIARHTRKRNL